MKTPNNSTTQATEAAPQKKPGRPAKRGAPVPAKNRAAEYRARRREAASRAHENIKDAAPAVLLAGLVRHFKALAKNDPEHAPVSRWLAGELILELCDRYEIELPRSPGAFDQDAKGGAGKW